jgi:voltage-gated potassium channel
MLQTVTTVGYGDVVPSGVDGKVIGGVEMVIGVAFISFLTAGVTSAIVQSDQASAEQVDRQREERDRQKLADAMREIRTAIADINRRLEQAH